MAELTHTDIREQVRERYAAAAKGASCCGDDVFGATLYDDEGDASLKGAVEASLGCGVPTAVADLHEGETVLDLGSGAGADVLISARRVGPTGKAIGLDMTDEKQWTCCIGGALTRGQFEAMLANEGLVDIEIRETHRVHEHAGSAIVRARKPPT